MDMLFCGTGLTTCSVIAVVGYGRRVGVLLRVGPHFDLACQFEPPDIQGLLGGVGGNLRFKQWLPSFGSRLVVTSVGKDTLMTNQFTLGLICGASRGCFSCLDYIQKSSFRARAA